MVSRVLQDTFKDDSILPRDRVGGPNSISHGFSQFFQVFISLSRHPCIPFPLRTNLTITCALNYLSWLCTEEVKKQAYAMIQCDF